MATKYEATIQEPQTSERPKSPNRAGSATAIIVELSGASMAPSATVTRIVRSAIRRSETIPVTSGPRPDMGGPDITRDNPQDPSGADQNPRSWPIFLRGLDKL